MSCRLTFVRSWSITFVVVSTMIPGMFGLPSDDRKSGGDNESATTATATGSVSTAGLSQYSKMKWGAMKSRDLIHEKARECLYDKNCSPLFKHIEQEAWGAVTSFLKSGFWPGSFFADSVTPAVQACTWVNRFDPDDPEKLKWSRLPLQ
jgi:hypothetical protein